MKVFSFSLHHRIISLTKMSQRLSWSNQRFVSHSEIEIFNTQLSSQTIVSSVSYLIFAKQFHLHLQYQHYEWVISIQRALAWFKNQHPFCVFTIASPIFHSAYLWHACTISLCLMPVQAIVAPLSILFPWEAVWNCWPLPSPLQPRRRLRPWNYGNRIRRRSPWLIDEQSRASHTGSGDGTDVHAVLGVTNHQGMWKPGGTCNHGSPVKISVYATHSCINNSI